MLTHLEMKAAVRNAIEAVGLDAFKRTSMFMSNNKASVATVRDDTAKAA
ncbi:hypothetical protein M3N55_04735 [Roseibaca sp. V10]|uniref:Uncharacterized protein n=1 Tax=Roseinatronobacter domitianus TaxID=2940293 RepID=A0ABT0M0A6_9RHOB|nr:hypothetical protein [Roseibaca domitiana]MCL1628028.1 hypothetical protein [Roseibaca domitiana]